MAVDIWHDVMINSWIKQAQTLRWEHRETWRDKPDLYWLAGLLEEVGEFASALRGEHEHVPEYEAAQIIAIMENWLIHRKARPPHTRGKA